jgi:hypothetical protein
VALLVGGSTVASRGATTYATPTSGLITLLVLIAAVAVLFTRRYPRGIFEVVMGLNRWAYRALVYALPPRDEYKPFRLDMGESDPVEVVAPAAPAPPGPLAQPWPHGA